MAEAVRKTVLEFGEDFKFPLLQTSGPVVQLTAGVPNYDPMSFFGSPSDQSDAQLDIGGDVINKFNSIFLYSGPYISPTDPTFTGTNAGYDLTFRTINNLEVLLNIRSMPVHWSRYNNQIWIASTPDKDYNCYARYQRANPFPNRGTSSAGSDEILFPNTWQDIVEYGASQRLAQIYNLSTKATELNTRLFGDSKFQRTDGLEGEPGLIFRRTSQENRDQSTSVKRLRLKMTTQR
jgi:hypothetical protein